MSDVDKEDMKGAIEDFVAQLKEAVRLAQHITVIGEIDRIIVCGMGGSAIAGDILKCYLADTKANITVNRDYSLPPSANVRPSPSGIWWMLLRR